MRLQGGNWRGDDYNTKSMKLPPEAIIGPTSFGAGHKFYGLWHCAVPDCISIDRCCWAVTDASGHSCFRSRPFASTYSATRFTRVTKLTTKKFFRTDYRSCTFNSDAKLISGQLFCLRFASPKLPIIKRIKV